MSNISLWFWFVTHAPILSTSPTPHERGIVAYSTWLRVQAFLSGWSGSNLGFAILMVMQIWAGFLGSLSRVWLFATPWTVAWKALLSMGFLRQEYWTGLPLPPPRDIPDSWIEPTSPESPALAGSSFTTLPPGKLPHYTYPWPKGREPP